MPGTSASKVASLLAFQQTLIADRRRNQAFRQALEARVRSGDAVVDIGSGTGIWAVVAARCGARRVVAIEREPLLVPVIERLAAENDVAERVEVVCADVGALDLPREFDLAICETVGTGAFEEGVLGHLTQARTRFVRPGGGLVPEQIALRAAPTLAPPLAPAGLQAESFRALSNQVPHWIAPGRLRTLARACTLLSVDLREADPGQPIPPGQAEFTMADVSRVGGLGVWVELGLGPGLRLSTRGTHWGSVMLPIDPLPEASGRLRFEVAWSPSGKGHRWSVEFFGCDGSHRRAEHAPEFALGSLLRAQPGGQVFP